MTATDATIVRRDPQHAATRKTGHKYVFFFYSFIYTGTIGATEILLGYG